MDRFWLLTYIVAWALVLIEGFALCALFSILGRVHQMSAPRAQALITEEGPDLHTALPPLAGEDSTGRLLRAADFQGRELALLFLSPGCAPCEQLLRHLRSRPVDDQKQAVVLVVLEATRGEADEITRRYTLRCPMIVDPDAHLRLQLGVERTPYAFLVDADGVIRMKGVVNDGIQLAGLINRRGQFLGEELWQTEEQKTSEAISV